jgi:hypothetical protein
MTRGPVVAAGVLVLAAGIAAVSYSALGGGDVGRATTPREVHLAQAYPRAAAAAYGRRVLVLRAHPLAAVAGETLESARVGGGWELHPAAPAGATDFATALAVLAAQAASDWDADGMLDAGTIDSLARAGVAIVVVDDGKRVVAPELAAEAAGLAPEPSVPSLRVRGAEPVWRVVGDAAAAGGTRAVLEPARVRDFVDGLWGGSVTVEVEEPGTYVLAWPREGALVTVDGAQRQPLEPLTRVPLVTLDLPAGDAAVVVRYAAARGRSSWAIGGALAIVISLIVLLLALRPHPERDDDDGHEGGDDGSDGGEDSLATGDGVA